MTALAQAIDHAARECIRAALVASSGNVTAAAVALDVPRRTLDKYIVRLDLRTWLTEEYERGARQPAR